jgi:predicted DNA-binding protein
MSRFNKNSNTEDNMVRTNIYITPEQNDFLIKVSLNSGVKKSQYVRIAIQEYIERNKKNEPI